MTKTFLSFCAAALLAVAPTHSPAQTQTPATRTAKPASAYGKLPMRFEPSPAASGFVSRGPGYTALLEATRATLVLHSGQQAAKAQPSVRAAGLRETVTMALAGANPHAAVTGEQKLPGYVNYMYGPDRSKWQLGLPTFAATRVSQAYPGVDLVYYGTERQLEYDFIVKPSADPAGIRLQIDGAHPILAAGGDLRLQAGSTAKPSDLIFRKPVVYQQVDGARKPVAGAWLVAANGDVSFQIGAYDRTRELVIDPLIAYASYFGGAGEDEINASTLNAANQLYAVGQTFSASLPSGTGEFQPTRSASKNSNYHDGFVTKFSADGSTVLWTTYLAGAGDDMATGVAVNAADQAYVVGNTQSCGSGGTSINTAGEFPFTADSIQTLCNPDVIGFNNYESNGGSYDVFLVKLSSDGKTLLYGTPLGGTANDLANSVVLDAAGRVYIVGETVSTQYKYSVSPNQYGYQDIPSYPINNHGTVGMPGPANFPTTGTAFYTNTTESKQYSSTDSQGNVIGPQDEQAFLTILSADLHSFVYSSLIGGGVIGGCGNGACNTNGYAVAVNMAGQAFIGGNTSSAHFPTTSGAFASACSNAGTATSQCPETGWLAGFNPGGSGASSLLFSTYITGSSGGTSGTGGPIYPGSDVFGLTTDSSGNVIATGDTGANNFPTTTGVLQPTCFLSGDGNGDSNVCANAYVTKLSPTGSTVWSTYYRSTTSFTGGESIVGQGVAVDASNNVYVVGTSNANNLPFKNPLVASPGGTDAFLIELSQNASSVLLGTYLGSGAGVLVNNNSLHLDSSLNAYFSGSQGYNPYGGTYLPVTGNAADKMMQGSADGFVVKMATQLQSSATTLTITPTNPAPNTPVAFSATVTGLAGATVPSGTVILTSGTTTLGSITLTNGTGSFTSSTIPGGTYSVIGTYSADVSYATSASTAQTLAITVTPTVTLTATPSTAPVGTAIVLKATVASTGTTPTGTVYFMDGTTTLGSMVLSGGTASYTATSLAVGPHSITAHYGGDGANLAFNSTAQTVTITTATPTVTLTATPTTATIGTAVALSATVAGSGATPTGTVKFMDGTTLLSTFTLAGTSGVATYSATALAAGTHSISAVYSGDGNFAGITSTAQTVTINLFTAAVTLTASPTTALAGATITFGATVSGTGATPTGTVKFLDGTTVLTTAPLAGGTASYSTTALTAGTHSITAMYSGDANFAAITSTAQTVTITAIQPTISLSANPSMLTIKSGTTGTTVITVTPAGGYTGTLTFACGSLPSAASCGFAPATLVFTGGVAAQTSTLTINTYATHAMLEQPFGNRPFNHRLPVAAFAGLLLLPLTLGRRAKRVLGSQWRALSVLILLGVFATLSVTGCGSSGTSFGSTPAGTYSVPVTVTGGNASNALSLQVTVQ